MQIVTGGESQPNLSARLQAPYTGAIDVASFDLRDVFTVRYTIVTEAIDTEQFDSRISAYACDPLDPGNGSSFAYTGLVPIATAPEPTMALLMRLGLGGLAAFAPSRRRGTPGA